VSIPPGFRELKEAIGFAAANGPWFEKIENGRAIRGFLPGPEHANALGIVHGGMLAAFLDSAMGTAVFHTLQRRAVTLRLSLDYLGPGRVGDWLQGRGRGLRPRRARGAGARPPLWAAPRGADRAGRLRAARPPPHAPDPALDWAIALLGSI